MDNRKLAGQIVYEDGYKIDMKNVKYADGVLTYGSYVDYDYVSVKAKIEGKKLTGNVNTPEGDMKVTASKTK